MAIVIPSKHIYDKDNDKVRDNKIDKVEITASSIANSLNSDSSVYTEKIIFSKEMSTPYKILFADRDGICADMEVTITSTYENGYGELENRAVKISNSKGVAATFIDFVSDNILKFKVTFSPNNIGMEDVIKIVEVNEKQAEYSLTFNTEGADYYDFTIDIGDLSRYVSASQNHVGTTSVTVSRNDTDGYYFAYAVAQAVYTKYYLLGRIYIPLNNESATIDTIKTGIDSNSNANITYSPTIIHKTGTVSNSYRVDAIVQPAGTVQGSYVSGISVIGNKLSIDRKLQDSNTIENLDIDSILPVVECKEWLTAGGGGYRAHAAAVLADETNLSTVPLKYNNVKDAYYFDVKVLVGVGYDTLSAKNEKVEFTPVEKGGAEKTEYFWCTCTGDSDFYIPYRVDIQFNGDKIELDIQNQTITINGDGSHPISFEGNELMQTTNYVMDDGSSKDQLTTAFGKTMDLYKNGKETATITCDIHDDAYYNITKNLSYNTKNSTEYNRTDQYDFYTTEFGDCDDRSKTFRFEVKCTPNSSKIVTTVEPHNSVLYQETIDLETGMVIIDGITMKENNSVSLHVDCTVLVTETTYKDVSLHITCNPEDEIDLYKWLGGNDEDESVTINGVKLYVNGYDESFLLAGMDGLTGAQFDALQKGVDKLQYKMPSGKIHYEIGDIVIPMVYGANGVDKPMSKYADGTPKQFQVQGVRIYYDGAVWQELTLQEFSQ